MAAIDHLPLEPASGDPSALACWDVFVAQASRWCAQHRVSLRDAVVLVPFAQLLSPARSAFGRLGGWLPRIETTHTLARALGPAARLHGMQLGGDRASDVLMAAQVLEAQADGRAWARRDPLGFDMAATLLAQTAADIMRAAAAIAPAQRAAHWERARALLAPAPGPGAVQRWLSRTALEWAAQSTEPATDRLFALRPAAWIVLQAGGRDELAHAVLASADAATPCLVVDADPPPDRLLGAAMPSAVPAFALCDSFEDEAQAAAAQAVAHLADGRSPVALIALDRVLVRRVRALLEAAGASVADETGWRLSTTRAAARLMALLRAADPQAGTDLLFDWLKGLPAWPDEPAFGERVAALEAACRRLQVARIDALARSHEEALQSTFSRRVVALLQGLAAAPQQPVASWLERLAQAAADCGLFGALQADDAGRQVLAALRLDRPASERADWLRSAGTRVMDLPALRAWIDGVLEAETFRPPAPLAGAQVVITPLAQSIWRPFAAVVVPGASDRHLGAPTPLHPLLPTALLAPLGLPDATTARHDEAAAFAHLVAAAPMTLLRRRLDGPEPLADSPLVERLRLELARRGQALAAWQDPRLVHEVAVEPPPRPEPSAAALLPRRLSASAAEALRDCPYRFFALHVLRLREVDELDAEVEKRDYGTWLHDVLRDFHVCRPAPRSVAQDVEQLHDVGIARRDALGLDEAEFLPFAASFAAFVPRYVDWLHGREAEGATWRDAERELQRALPDLPDTQLHGRIDRIDHRERPTAGDDLIDYKTGNAQKLRDKVARPLEDTQLAFYAALLQPQAQGPLRAMYLALDSNRALDPIEHEDVAASADALVAGLTHDLQRLRGGAPMPALGTGASCDFCAARGLCRRDHWAAPPEALDEPLQGGPGEEGAAS
jgi:ATP-dependent helicase/nuclease subunit B